MSVEQSQQETLYNTKNKTLMEYAIKYLELNQYQKHVLYQINFVRLKKGVILQQKSLDLMEENRQRVIEILKREAQ